MQRSQDPVRTRLLASSVLVSENLRNCWNVFWYWLHSEEWLFINLVVSRAGCII